MSAFMHVENEPDYGRVRRYLDTWLLVLWRRRLSVSSVGGCGGPFFAKLQRSAVGGYG